MPLSPPSAVPVVPAQPKFADFSRHHLAAGQELLVDSIIPEDPQATALAIHLEMHSRVFIFNEDSVNLVPVVGFHIRKFRGVMFFIALGMALVFNF